MLLCVCTYCYITGDLLVGDQLLEANGVSLVGVSNEKYIVIKIMDGQIDKSNKWMDGRKDDGQTDGWMDGWTDGQTDGWMDGWIIGRQ